MGIEFIKEKQLSINIPYLDHSEDSYLQQLRHTYNLKELLDAKASDFQNFKNIQSWVLSKWNSKNRTCSGKEEIFRILKKAKKANYGYIDYNTITSACLQSLGYKLRRIWLSSPDAKKLRQRSVHVIYEVYLKDLNKWFFIDPKYDIMICKDGIPLNAVEFQQAIIDQEELEVHNPVEVISSEDYLEWISPYLFCFTISLNKGAISIWDRLLGVKKKLTLVPVGEMLPDYFRSIKRLTTNLVTNSLDDFYPDSIQN